MRAYIFRRLQLLNFFSTPLPSSIQIPINSIPLIWQSVFAVSNTPAFFPMDLTVNFSLFSRTFTFQSLDLCFILLLYFSPPFFFFLPF